MLIIILFIIPNVIIIIIIKCLPICFYDVFAYFFILLGTNVKTHHRQTVGNEIYFT